MYTECYTQYIPNLLNVKMLRDNTINQTKGLLKFTNYIIFSFFVHTKNSSTKNLIDYNWNSCEIIKKIFLCRLNNGIHYVIPLFISERNAVGNIIISEKFFCKSSFKKSINVVSIINGRGSLQRLSKDY